MSTQTQVEVQVSEIIKLDSQQLVTQIKLPSPSPSTFALSNLPSELRHEIYAHYFSNLPPHHISCADITQHQQDQKQTQKQPQNPHPNQDPNLDEHEEASLPEFHTLNPLHLCSSNISNDIPTWLYYHHTTFSFSCPSALKSFSTIPLTNYVRTLCINYGKIGEEGPDWVYLMLKGFEKLEEVVFVVEKEEGCRCCRVGVGAGVWEERLGHWWGCVGDAFREGSKNGKKGKGVRLVLEVRKKGKYEAVKE